MNVAKTALGCALALVVGFFAFLGFLGSLLVFAEFPIAFLLGIALGSESSYDLVGGFSPVDFWRVMTLAIVGIYLGGFFPWFGAGGILGFGWVASLSFPAIPCVCLFLGVCCARGYYRIKSAMTKASMPIA